MKKYVGLWGAFTLLALSDSALALDSYRYLHVTIDTPWLIFIFLLPLVLAPIIIIAILYWYFAARKRAEGAEVAKEPEEA